MGSFRKCELQYMHKLQMFLDFANQVMGFDYIFKGVKNLGAYYLLLEQIDQVV